MEKIQELTEKIYREGVEKGQQEAERIIAEAREQAENIVAEAREQAQTIEQVAKKKAAELDTNTKNELKLYTGQALNALKSEVANVLTDKVVGDDVQKLAEDKDFLGRLAVTLAEKWTGDEPAVISAKDAEQMLDRTNGYPLECRHVNGADYGSAYRHLFINGNSFETIFELYYSDNPSISGQTANTAITINPIYLFIQFLT